MELLSIFMGTSFNDRSQDLLHFPLLINECTDMSLPRPWGVILNNLALNLQGPLNRLFAWSCTIGESDSALKRTIVHIRTISAKMIKKYEWAKVDT